VFGEPAQETCPNPAACYDRGGALTQEPG